METRQVINCAPMLAAFDEARSRRKLEPSQEAVAKA
jgi:hypothetical protein